MKSIEDLLDLHWKQYSGANPGIQAINRLLAEAGNTVKHDHIAFRTLNLPTIAVGRLAVGFENVGYHSQGEYHFDEKNLFARHYEHEDPNRPLLFISELMVDEFSSEAQDILHSAAARISPDSIKEWNFSASGRHWPINHADYEILREESEYAAWFYAFGFRANHFAVCVNQLETPSNLEELNALLKQNGYALNDHSGEIKGSPELFLEQSSTMADAVPLEFEDGVFEIPACYYEFAKRHPMPDGNLFRGFIAASADKIFESADSR